MKRDDARHIAINTLNILKEGSYVNDEGETVSIQESTQQAIHNSRLFKPDTKFEDQKFQIDHFQTLIQVTQETTLECANRLWEHYEQKQRICVLNFASARNPGGKFLNGAIAQEESIARASALYPCIVQMEDMYEANRRSKSCLYTHHMIYSPDVPVLKDDGGQLLDQPFPLSFITCPAPNAGVVRQHEANAEALIEATMKERIRRILCIAASQGHTSLVLGAFGCGVFKNHPAQVAQYFYDFLFGPRFKGVFEHVVFAIYENEFGENLTAFEQRFLADKAAVVVKPNANRGMGGGGGGEGAPKADQQRMKKAEARKNAKQRQRMPSKFSAMHGDDDD